jgi:hypothetical protein
MPQEHDAIRFWWQALHLWMDWLIKHILCKEQVGIRFRINRQDMSCVCLEALLGEAQACDVCWAGMYFWFSS